jgi:hypothetical protein
MVQANKVHAAPIREIEDIWSEAPIKHIFLPHSWLIRIELLHNVFYEVLEPEPLVSLIDKFRQDDLPEDEIQIWELMAAAYSKLTAGRTLEPEHKREIFLALLLISWDSLTEEQYSEFHYITPQIIKNE